MPSAGLSEEIQVRRKTRATRTKVPQKLLRKNLSDNTKNLLSQFHPGGEEDWSYNLMKHNTKNHVFFTTFHLTNNHINELC